MSSNEEQCRPRSWRSGVEHKYKLCGGKESIGHDSVWNLRPKIATSDSSALAASEYWWAVPYEGGGGPIFISGIDTTGRIEPTNATTINGHKAEVYCIDFSKLDGNLLASGGDDGNVCIWRLDHEDSTLADKLPLSKLKEPTGIREVLFHSTVANAVLSATVDGRLGLWDLQKDDNAARTWDLEQSINCLDLNYDGTLVISSCRDRCARITDLRTDTQQVLERPHGDSSRIFKAKFIHNRGHDFILSTGPSVSTTGREVALFDLRKGSNEALFRRLVDGQNGALMPFYYEEFGVVWLFGRGDTTVRQFEINATAKSSDEAFFPGLDFRCGSPHTGAAQLPGRSLDVKKLEIARFKRLTASTVETVSFTIPRSAELKEFFNDDVFDMTRSSDPAIDSLTNFLPPQISNDDDSTILPLVDASPRLISLRPDGMPLLSERPVEEKVLNTQKINTQRKIEQDQHAHDQAQFEKLASLANQFEKYQPNNSMGARKGVDSLVVDGNEVDDDEWDD
mmetsp:Transcript_6692/g.9359  ORF Transcript_6692/g.9359 Transcript_6692/m.9359 type:complete len:509 (+) Transcript_6692:73-1599(+)|eukprot:CAMPEP_0197304156 /NCGR_PEP_ID=MMETSP0890-20130614/52091_1 /TAXON_ID=44058 ORGANISM="Aureoumbra lagunensis, Strain CCMP1510" /NCGR_SAMPLE_ID=MMETSP0890 /ASSEMBLY_ACC=CAM_ASM_000533 /LENGTH=508 /DNA_ID=CAMNT_0042784127 /DNA_START=3709 /DNA_END=5235 /DNA_ORIENTATION=+